MRGPPESCHLGVSVSEPRKKMYTNEMHRDKNVLVRSHTIACTIARATMFTLAALPPANSFALEPLPCLRAVEDWTRAGSSIAGNMGRKRRVRDDATNKGGRRRGGGHDEQGRNKRKNGRQ